MKHLIFDLDGTLLNSLPLFYMTLKQVCEEWNMPELSQADFDAIAALPALNALEALNFQDLDGALSRWLELCYEEESVDLFDGVESVLATLSSRQKLAVFSSKRREQYDRTVKTHPIAGYFSSVVLFEDTTRHKPYPDGLLLVCKQMDWKPEDCIYIGDTHHDEEAARAAGMDFVLALWGAQKGLTSNKMIDTPSQLLSI
ncbi:MAG: HAD family hydrolase [Erysipelotrichaceae bacterium]